MAKYKVTARVAVIPSGVIAITAAQAEHRKNNLHKLGNNRYEIRSPVEFKAGEVVGYEGDLPKVLATAMDEADTRKSATGGQSTAQPAAQD